MGDVDLDDGGLFLVGGVVKSRLTNADRQIVQDHLASLLQVHNLVILFGSGASFHLGSPKTRELKNSAVEDLVKCAGRALDETDHSLLALLNPTDNGDLEKLLNGLQLAATLASQSAIEEVTLGSGDGARAFLVSDVEQLRDKINAALAFACRLPADGAQLNAPYDEDPLWAHRTFLSRLVRSRRGNLPRPKVFTTNYDLVIERSLDQLGYPYIDGFSGTVNRKLNLAYYGLDFHRVETSSQNVVARADNALYLHKIHGSLNWRASLEKDVATGIESLEVLQVADDSAGPGQRVLIYPTTAKEGDTLSYPYSDLLRLLGDAVQQDDTAVISIGYGFADPHINRILLRSLATNPALNVLVADPFAVLGDSEMSSAQAQADIVGRNLKDAGYTPRSTALGSLASGADSRIAVLTGESGKFVNLAELLPDPALGSSLSSPAAIISLIESLEQAAKVVAAPASPGGAKE